MVWKIEKGMSLFRAVIPKSVKENFLKFCVLANKTTSQAVCEAISEYLTNHQYEVRSNITININTMNVNIYVKAKVTENKAELKRLLTIVKNIKDPQARTDFLVELAKRIQKAYEVYEKTKDPELGELLKECEKYL